ncbi:YaaR family protein [Peribacillus kribbensis]|uniref:YaaR family protein n=1 Tax=Peribacillus kribbensis TaxID=356658 RepID=UPI00047DF660|nr:YaaR family protein [Peribacillus kribbensis]
MKINQEPQINLDKLKTEQRQTSPGSRRFTDFIQKQDQKMQLAALDKLLSEIQGAGDRLSRSKNFKDLAKFKTLVKRFVREAVDNGMELNQSQSWNSYGQGRSLTTVKTIDEKLVELTDEVRKSETESIDLLGRIGEIKGLLINLYT